MTYDFHARQYDPQIGRFWSVDPASQFPSGYTGMGNDPGNMVDPTGWWSNQNGSQGSSGLGGGGQFSGLQLAAQAAYNATQAAFISAEITQLAQLNMKMNPELYDAVQPPGASGQGLGNGTEVVYDPSRKQWGYYVHFFVPGGIGLRWVPQNAPSNDASDNMLDLIASEFKSGVRYLERLVTGHTASTQRSGDNFGTNHPVPGREPEYFTRSQYVDRMTNLDDLISMFNVANAAGSVETPTNIYSAVNYMVHGIFAASDAQQLAPFTLPTSASPDYVPTDSGRMPGVIYSSDGISVQSGPGVNQRQSDSITNRYRDSIMQSY